MTSVVEAFQNVLPAKRRYTRNGWIEFKCPACGDRRGRGSFMVTDTGGFRYFCFNGGCEYEKATGYEPDGEGGLGGRVRSLFELLGGDPINLPWDQILRQAQNPDKPAEPRSPDQEIVTSFAEVELPRDCVPLRDVKGEKGLLVKQYLESRGPYLDLHEFYWSPAHPLYLIIPWVHDRGKVVGWCGRHIYKKGGDPDRFIFCQEKPADYLFNQHLIRTHAGRKLFVVEGDLDAVPLGCVATHGSKLTRKQINLLRLSGKDIVLIPDRDAPDSFLDIAQEQSWLIACPDWVHPLPGKVIKDVGQAVQTFGRLYTIESIMSSITDNWLQARVFYQMNRGK